MEKGPAFGHLDAVVTVVPASGKAKMSGLVEKEHSCFPVICPLSLPWRNQSPGEGGVEDPRSRPQPRPLSGHALLSELGWQGQRRGDKPPCVLTHSPEASLPWGGGGGDYI